MLDLNNHVVFKLPVERMKIIVGGPGAIILRLTPVKVMVVDKGAIKNETAMGLERLGNHVGGIRRSASVGGRPKLTLRIRFHHEAAKIRSSQVDAFHLLAPPFRNASI